MHRLLDAHMHFNLSSADPVMDLLAQLDSVKASGCVLILNSDDEEGVFLRNKPQLLDNNYNIFTSTLINLQTSKKEELPYVKIHPRLTGLTRDDIPKMMSLVDNCGARVITIDCFVYGHFLSNDIGVELGIELAKRFCEKKIVLAHAGGVRLLECIMQTKTLQNIFYDLSLTLNYLWHSSIQQDMILLLKYHNNRVLFGSDYPSFKLVEAETNMEKLCSKARLSCSEANMLYYENALRLYEKGGEMS